jgi:hypothetical protein
MRRLVATDASLLLAASPSLLADDRFLRDVVHDNPLLLRTQRRDGDGRVISRRVPFDIDALLEKYPELATERRALEEDLAALDIEYPDRFAGGAMLQAVVRNRRALARDERLSGRPLVVVFYPKSDWNGALYFPRLDGLVEAHDPVYFEAEVDHELPESLASAARAKPIDLLILGGHGNATSLSLGDGDPRDTSNGGYEERSLDLSDRAEIPPSATAAHLAAESQVLAISCSNASGRGRVPNMAQWYAELFPRSTIFTSVFPTNLQLRLSEDGRFRGPSWDLGPVTGHVTSGGRRRED